MFLTQIVLEKMEKGVLFIDLWRRSLVKQIHKFIARGFSCIRMCNNLDIKSDWIYAANSSCNYEKWLFNLMSLDYINCHKTGYYQ